MIFRDVRRLETADFFGLFALISMEHVLGDIRFLLDSSKHLVVMSDVSLLVRYAAEPDSCLHLGLGPLTPILWELVPSVKLLVSMESLAPRASFFPLSRSLAASSH